MGHEWKHKGAILDALNEFLATPEGVRYKHLPGSMLDLVWGEKKIYRMMAPDEVREVYGIEPEEREAKDVDVESEGEPNPVDPDPGPDPPPDPAPPIYKEEDGTVTNYVEKLLDKMNAATIPEGKNIQDENNWRGGNKRTHDDRGANSMNVNRGQFVDEMERLGYSKGAAAVMAVAARTFDPEGLAGNAMDRSNEIAKKAEKKAGIKRKKFTPKKGQQKDA